MKGVEVLGTLSSNLQGSFRIRDLFRRVSVMVLGKVKVSGNPQRTQNSSGTPSPERAHYLDELDGQRALAHAAAAHDHQLVSLAGRGVPGSRPPAPGPPPSSPGRRPAAHVATAAAAAATAWGSQERLRGGLC